MARARQVPGHRPNLVFERVSLRKRERLSGLVGRENRRARPRCGDAWNGEPAAELDDPEPAERQPVDLIRERHAASPQNRPVRRDRRPFHPVHIGQLGRLARLADPQGTARQLDGSDDQLVEHRLDSTLTAWIPDRFGATMVRPRGSRKPARERSRLWRWVLSGSTKIREPGACPALSLSGAGPLLD